MDIQSKSFYCTFLKRLIELSKLLRTRLRHFLDSAMLLHCSARNSKKYLDPTTSSHASGPTPASRAFVKLPFQEASMNHEAATILDIQVSTA